MLYLIIILQISIVVFLALLVIILKSNKTNKNNKSEEEIKELKDKIEYLSNDLTNQMGSGLNNLNNNLLTQLNQMSNKSIETVNILKNNTDTLDKKFSNQNIQQLNMLRGLITDLESKLNQQNEQSSKHIKEVITRVTSLDNIKQQMINLNDNISSLEKILNDKKARGTFGEVRLKQILEAVFGEGQKSIFEEQFMLSNGRRVDFILHAPYPIGDLAIDSKFPLENYLNIVNATNDAELIQAQRDFKKDLKKHIDDISNKYIIEGETSTQAMMFIPAEAIFSYINASGEDIINYSYEKKVWITAPTTFMSIMNLLLLVLKDMKRNDSYLELFDELTKLKVEFDRYDNRWQTFNKTVDKMYKEMKDINTTSTKIVKKFAAIEKMEIDKENISEEVEDEKDN